MARFLAKTIVDRGWARRALVQLAYAIGVAEPVSFLVETFGTESDHRVDFAAELSREFDLRPQGIIQQLDLLRPIYYPTAAYGHFGRNACHGKPPRRIPFEIGSPLLQFKHVDT
jgi:S-adenosylmethionine synthetase